MGSDINPELSQTGLEQAQKLAEFFKNKKITKIYSSDLKRASGTAEIIAHKLNIPVETTELLREMKIGKWAGRRNVLKKWMKYYNKQKSKGITNEQIRPPGGENSWDHEKRIRKFLSLLESQKGNILVVAHAGTNKVIIGTIQGKNPDDFYETKQDPACINEIQFAGNNWKIVKVNKTI